LYYYNFNISAWYLSTNYLSPEEEGIYFRLINHYYDSEQPIPLETQSVLRRLRLSSHSETVLQILNDFFEKTDKGYFHNRCDKELKEYRRNAKKNRANGRKGGRPRAGAASTITQEEPSGLSVGTQEEPSGNPVGTQEEPRHNPNYKLLTTNYKLLTINHKPLTIIDENIKTIFSYWRDCMGKPKAKFLKERKACIKARIKEGFTVDQIKQAVDGCKKSPHHMGKNDSNAVYNDLTLICRKGTMLEWFINNNNSPCERTSNEPQDTKERSIQDDLSDTSWANNVPGIDNTKEE